MTPCKCTYQCPDCPRTFAVPLLCHDHRVKVHGHACGGEP